MVGPPADSMRDEDVYIERLTRSQATYQLVLIYIISAGECILSSVKHSTSVSTSSQ